MKLNLLTTEGGRKEWRTAQPILNREEISIEVVNTVVAKIFSPLSVVNDYQKLIYEIKPLFY